MTGTGFESLELLLIAGLAIGFTLTPGILIYRAIRKANQVQRAAMRVVADLHIKGIGGDPLRFFLWPSEYQAQPRYTSYPHLDLSLARSYRRDGYAFIYAMTGVVLLVAAVAYFVDMF